MLICDLQASKMVKKGGAVFYIECCKTNTKEINVANREGQR